MRFTVAALLLSTTSIFGQTVEVPKTVEVAPGRLASVAIKYDGDDVKWIVGKSIDIFREYDPDPKVIKLRVIGYEPGKFNLVAISAKAGKLSEFAICEIVVTGPTPPQPPTPTPPGPGPNPPTPNPDSPLVAELKKAIEKDGAQAIDVKNLGEGYKAASSFTASFSGRVADLVKGIREIARPSAPEKIPTIAKVCNDYMRKFNLPNDLEANLTPEQIKLIAKILLEIALALLEASK